MTDLERFREWVQSYPDLPVEYMIDYTNEIPNTGAIFQNGLVEISRAEDILGNITIANQHNFAIYRAFSKNEGDDVTAKVNAEWVMGFQKWVQEQSALKLAPTFGSIDTHKETMTAQNGQLLEIPDSGVGLYIVLVNANFKTYIGA